MIFALLESMARNNIALFSIISLSLLTKAGLFAYLLTQWHKKIIRKPYFFLMLILIGSIIIDLSWFIIICHWCSFQIASNEVGTFWNRTAWAFTAIYYQALALFIESFVSRNGNLSRRQKVFIFISTLFVLFFISLALFDYIYCCKMLELEITIKRALLFYCFFIIIPITLFSSFRKLKKANVPRLLKRQLTIFFSVFIIPVIISDFIQTLPCKISINHAANSYFALSFSTLLFSCALFYSIRRVLGLRFLNIKKHAQSRGKFSFVNDLDEVAKEFRVAEHTCELELITRNMFYRVFGIQKNNTQLHIRSDYYQQDAWGSRKDIIETVELCLEANDVTLSSFIAEERVLIYDEIDFDCYYDQSNKNKLLLQFMESINVDVFLPIYGGKGAAGYLIIKRGALGKKFYGNAERTELLAFVQYLTTTVDALQRKNFHEAIYEVRRKDEIIFTQHQEINQYRESYKSFLHEMNERKIGIAFYHNKRFSFGNEMAENFIAINLNVQVGHHITKALKKLAQTVRQYREPKSIFITDHNGNKLVVTAMIQYERFDVLLLIHHPEISDIITKRIATQSDPSNLDYILYLETTKAGRLVDQLLPGSGKIVLNFKITLLKAALSIKAVLLDTHKDDTMDCVQLLHSISLREKFHLLKLTHNQKNNEDTITLFGINHLFLDASQPQEVPLLKRLDKIGTLFIENIHFLSIKAQEQLADYICYGFFFVFKTEKRIPSNVRIICSSDQDLEDLANNGLFSKKLLDELQRTTINMPSLSLLPEDEFKELINGFEDQLLQQKEFKNFLTLTNKDKTRLIRRCPMSIGELQEDVKKFLVRKARENNLYEETVLDPTYGLTDPDLIEAIRLGKRALQDPKIMAMLMKKFDNNQSKIATFLGVNRSSVNRRFKKHDYTTVDEEKDSAEKNIEDKKTLGKENNA